MAGSADGGQPPREIEEGEVVSEYHAASGSDTDTDDEDARYYMQPHHDGNANGSAGSARGRNSPAASRGSDRTVSDAGAVTVARVAGDNEPAVFPCGVCRREFGSWKAVHGHMRVHAQAAKEERQVAAAAVVSGGGASAVEEVGDSSATVLAAIPRLFDDDTITPVQSACSNVPVANGGSGSSSARSSVEPSATGQSMTNVVAAPAPSAAAQEHVTVSPPPAPVQQVPAAPQQATAVPPPAAASQHLQPLQRVYSGPLHMTVRSDPSTSRLAVVPVENSQRGFSCRECGRWFPTHQGLGGHVAGHKNKRIAAEAAAAAAAGIDPQDHMACRGGARPAKSHACKVCGAEYPSGVSLGGHMRKHYNGKPIVPRKRLRLGLPELALAPPLQRVGSSATEAPIAAPPLASYEPAAQPAQAPLPAGSLRLFGVTITQQAQKDEEPPVDESMKEPDVDESVKEPDVDESMKEPDVDKSMKEQ